MKNLIQFDFFKNVKVMTTSSIAQYEEDDWEWTEVLLTFPEKLETRPTQYFPTIFLTKKSKREINI